MRVAGPLTRLVVRSKQRSALLARPLGGEHDLAVGSRLILEPSAFSRRAPDHVAVERPTSLRRKEEYGA
jgi:hypothetical protein